MSALMITISTGQALTFGLTLIGLGMLVQAAMYRFLDERDEAANELLVEDQDQAISVTLEVDATAAIAGFERATRRIPVQPATNGEDLLGGGPR